MCFPEESWKYLSVSSVTIWPLNSSTGPRLNSQTGPRLNSQTRLRLYSVDWTLLDASSSIVKMEANNEESRLKLKKNHNGAHFRRDDPTVKQHQASPKVQLIHPDASVVYICLDKKSTNASLSCFSSTFCSTGKPFPLHFLCCSNASELQSPKRQPLRFPISRTEFRWLCCNFLNLKL